ncbi:MAG TPA: hypothetical protein VN428_21965 [Bryobacteraceae bacterium]|nr:hypothetical protein [Bryobacteraceae bacterium]
MKSIKITLAVLCVVCAAVQVSAQSAQSEEPTIAYSHHGVLTLATASGRVVRTVRTAVPIGDFAISKDASTVVFVPLNSKTHGGPLYLLKTRTGNLTRLTRGPYFNKKSRSEVYSAPDLSPSDAVAVFAIHAQATGDAVEAAGPAAIVDLKTRAVKLLQTTVDVGGNGAAFVNAPHWSPDGRRIAVNFEAGAALTSPDGVSKLQDLSGLMEGGDWNHVLAWLGNECVVYVAGKDPNDAAQKPARVLNLKSHKVQDLSLAINVPGDSLTNLVAVSRSIRVRRNRQELSVEGPQKNWTIPYDGSTFVRILTTEGTGSNPAECATSD